MIENKLSQINNKLLYVLHDIPKRFLYIDTASQKMYLTEENQVKRIFDISTSKFGIGNQENSHQTPQGVHKIIEKIGHDAPEFRIFESRIDTGINWNGDLTKENMILSRILRLRGLEPGVNSGPGIDSYERYIYIHGTNREDLIGTPMSHGCICMRNKNIIELFTMVEEETIVIID